MINEIVAYMPKRQNLWDGKYKIPWDERGFSERMLKQHLSQAHDMASRRDELIEIQVQWIQNEILKNRNSRILDVGCGPGFYVSKLTHLGHQCTGIDFSPASIGYARRHCEKATFILKDVREADFGKDFDLAMFLFGEINVFSPKECRLLVEKMYSCLKPGGILLLEAHLYDAVKRAGQAPKCWFKNGVASSNDQEHWFDKVTNDGLFSENPHIVLIENTWLENEKIALSNFWILEDGKDVAHYVSTNQAYTDHEYMKILENAHFTNAKMQGDFGKPLTDSSIFQVISAKKCP